MLRSPIDGKINELMLNFYASFVPVRVSCALSVTGGYFYEKKDFFSEKKRWGNQGSLKIQPPRSGESANEIFRCIGGCGNGRGNCRGIGQRSLRLWSEKEADTRWLEEMAADAENAAGAENTQSAENVEPAEMAGLTAGRDSTSRSGFLPEPCIHPANYGSD